MRTIPPSIPGLKPIPEAAFELGGIRGDELAAELRRDGVAVFEFKVGRSTARLVHPDEYARWLARRTGTLHPAPAPLEQPPEWQTVGTQLQRQATALEDLQRQVESLLKQSTGGAR